MNWRALLNYDLGRLIGGRPVPDDGKKPVFWWTALGRLLRPSTAVSRGQGDVPYPRSVLRRALRPGWTGPIYWNARTWRRDVVLVVEQCRGLVACNAPLVPGLAAAAREEQRLQSAWTPQRATALLRNALITGAICVMGAGIALESDGLEDTLTVTMAVVVVILAWRLLRALLSSRHSRACVYLALERRIAGGASLSEAVGSLPRFFPRHLADLVEAGETAGNMPLAFEQFSEAMLHSLGVHRQFRLTLLYIKLVLCAQFLIAAFLTMKVVPVWMEMLQEIQPDAATDGASAALSFATMPLLPRIVPSLSMIASLGSWLVESWWILASVAATFFLWRVIGRFRRRRSWASRGRSSVLLWLPWFRGMVARHNLGLIAMMLHGLLRAGVPLDRALALAMGSDLLPAYRHWLGALRDRLQQGESLKDALDRVHSRRLIPESFSGLLEAGERSGQLPAMLEHIALLYQRDAERRMHVLAGLVLPAGIFLMGYITLCIQTMVFGSMASMIDYLIV